MDRNIEAVLNGLNVAVFVVDADHLILFRNAASTALFGIGLKGRKLGDFVPHKKCLKAVNEVLEGSPTATVDLKLQLVVPALFKVTVVRMDLDADLLNTYAVVSFEDVTHIREARQMRSDFVANVSHELRSPLTALSGFIETLQGPAKDDDEAQERFLSLMENEAQRMARLVEDLLSLSKLEATERLAPTLSVDIGGILRRVIATMDPIIQREQTNVVLDLADDLPPAYGDLDELTQVFSNLVENAAKYSQAGALLLVQAARDGQNADMLRVSVTDQGEGIAAKHIPRLTERFYRIDKGRSRDKGGTGLGLAIVKHILMRHRGDLEIQSEPGAGSVFSVLLPIEADGV
ncbi:MAG: histidine kinase [Rhodobacteraceae bacterium]|nr:histidine kinase [Paracoccaceae bacterium]